jgi:hypothetical protein
MAKSTLIQLRDLIADGLRSALFLALRPGAFNGSLQAALALCGLHLGASLLLSIAVWRGEFWIDPAGLSGDLASYAVLLAFLALVPFAGSGLTAARVFTGFVATALPCVLATAALTAGFFAAFGDDATAVPFAAVWLGFAWVYAAMFKAVVALAAAARWRSAVLTVMAGILATYALPYRSVLAVDGAAPPSLLQTAMSYLQPPAVNPATEPSEPRLDAEAILHNQPSLLDAKLATLKASDAARPNLYFVGFAPYADQDVFRREVIAVQELFDEKFATGGRSLVLINHRDDVLEHPLASMSNLESALMRLGKLMRRDKDILVLFVTTHGTQGELAVSFPRFPLNSITGERLAVALEKSEIQNRVLIISACHSGSLIPTLRTDHTLILTAAHSDKTSFGCSNENDWTYFGDAYFNQALRTQTSFIDAFTVARGIIAGWEKRDGLTASDPQMFIGERIRSKLDALPAPPATVTTQ